MNYEEETVAELKDLADERGLTIPSGALKADIIAILEAHDMTKAELKEQAEAQGVEIPAGATKADIVEALATEGELPEEGREAEGKNIYEYQMSSTETALCSPDDFWKLKLHS